MAVQSTREPAPQPVLSPLAAAAVLLVLTIDPGGERVVSDLLADLSGLRRSVAFRLPEGKLQAVADAPPAIVLPTQAPPAAAPPGDGSPGIGSLKG